MNAPAKFASPESGDEIKANVRMIAEEIRDRDLSSEFDSLRKLPEDIVDKLRLAGVFRMNMPRSWGGPELNPMDQIEIIETLSWGDASVGWCSFIWADSGIYSGYIEDDVARELYPELDLAQSGWVYPGGTAEEVEGGYEVTGHWIFGSGSNHCDRLAAGFVVVRDGVPVVDESGRPQWKIALARPDHFLRKMSGVPLGVARDALDRAIDVLSNKVDRRAGTAYRDNPVVQQTIADAEGKLGAARAYVFESVRNQWAKLEAGEELTDRERAAVMISRQQAFQTGRQVCQMMFDLIGGEVVYARSGFERQLRDMNTGCQHIVAQAKTLQGPGALLLGSEAANRDIML